MSKSKIITPPIRRLGNKRYILQVTDFVKYFPRTNKSGRYCELFLGTGVVALEYMKRNPSTNIILNDGDSKLIRMFEAIQKNRLEFEKRLEWRFLGSEKVINPKDELDESIIWYLQNQITTHFSQGVSLMKNFEEMKNLFEKNLTVFTNRDWKKALSGVLKDIKRITRSCNRNTHNANIIIYADPPYDDTKGYGEPFDIDEFLDKMNELYDSAVYIFISLNATDKVLQKLENWERIELYKYNKSPTRQARSEMLFSNKKFQIWNKNSIYHFFS